MTVPVTAHHDMRKSSVARINHGTTARRDQPRNHWSEQTVGRAVSVPVRLNRPGSQDG